MSIKRKAVLIEASKLAGHKELPGARQDIENLKGFLTSDAGGAWEWDEIAELHNPSASQVGAALQTARSADYAFVHFSGHGYRLRRERAEEDRVCLNGGDEYPVLKLDAGNPRCTCVIDSCRAIFVEERMEKVAMMAEVRKALDPAYRQQCRELFDATVMACEFGSPILLFSCAVGGTAAESDSGGTFTTSLIDCASGWVRSASGGRRQVLNMYDCFIRAKIAVALVEPRQEAEFSAGRRMRYFPIAVKP